MLRGNAPKNLFASIAFCVLLLFLLQSLTEDQPLNQPFGAVSRILRVGLDPYPSYLSGFFVEYLSVIVVYISRHRQPLPRIGIPGFHDNNLNRDKEGDADRFIGNSPLGGV